MMMKIKRQIRPAIAAACMLALLFSSISVHATSVDDLENSTASKENELSSINSALLELGQEIEGIQQQMVMTEGAIMQTEADITEIQEEESTQYDAMKARIKYLYEAGDTSFLEMLFSAKDMNDFLNKADFIQNVTDYDRDMLTELETTHQQIEDEHSVLKAQQASLEEMQSSVEEKQADLESQAAQASTDLASLNAQLEKARAEEAAALAAEAAAQAAAQAGSSGNQTTGGSGTVNVGGSSVSADDVTLLASICQAEAYQNYDYLLAVATVIMNRVNSSRFPNTVSGVVYASGQFEPTWTGRLDGILASGPTSLSLQVAQDAINGARLASVSDCYFFLTAWTGHAGINVGGNVFFQSW